MTRGTTCDLHRGATGNREAAHKIRVGRKDPGKDYYDALESEFAAGSADPPKEFLNTLGGNDGIEVDVTTYCGGINLQL